MWEYTIRHKKLLLANFITVFGFIIIELGLPTLLGMMIDQGVNAKNFAVVKQFGWMMVAVTVVGITLNLTLTYVGAKLTTSIIKDVRDDTYKKIQTFSHQEFEKFGVSSLITRVTNDAYQVMLFLGLLLRTGFMTPIMFVSSLIMIVRHSPRLALYVVGAIPFLLLGVWLIATRSEPLSKKQQKNLDGVNMILRENLTGLRVIRAFVNEKFNEKRFDEVNQRYTNVSMKLFRLMAGAQPIFFFLFNIVMALIIWAGAKQINVGALELGALVAVIEYIFHALFSFMMFAAVFMMYPRASVSANRIQEVLDAETSIPENETGVRETKTHGVLEFKGVTFAYPGSSESPTLRDINFKARPGETIAFIGSTGSGKSTLVQLIPRFYDVTKGQVLIDGIDVRDYDLEALRKKIGYIPQKATLFTGTIKDNLLYGKEDATEEDFEYATEVAQATEFISEKKDGFDELLSEGGANFSGGQKQRLAIARAVIRRPDIYVFDDSFSALDYQTDANLRARLSQETKDSTVVIVAQRVSTIRHADQIVVLNEGNVVGIGTHEELLQSSEIYYDIASSQLSEEELA